MRPAAPRGFVDKSVAERVSDEDDELVPPLSEVVDTVLADAVEHQRPLQADRLPDADFFNAFEDVCDESDVRAKTTVQK